MRFQKLLCLVAVQLTAVTVTLSAQADWNPRPCSKEDPYVRTYVIEDLVYNNLERLKANCNANDVAEIKSAIEARLQYDPEQIRSSKNEESTAYTDAGRAYYMAKRLNNQVDRLEARLALEHLQAYLATQQK